MANEYLNNPLFHMGIGILGNQGRVGPGLQTGLGTLMQQRQFMGQQAQQQQQMEMQRQRMAMLQAAEARAATNAPVSFQQWQKMTPEQRAAYQQFETIGLKATEAPSSVRETQWFLSQPPEVQKQHLAVKRAQQVMNRGGSLDVLDPMNPSIPLASLPKTLRPSERPEYKAAAAAASAQGKELGTEQASLASMEAMQPRLESLVNELSILGKKATYTQAGQAANTIKRELGLNVGEGAVARKEYITKVDNEILPLLRQTFGAQFTEREGQSLKATLGDPDASPEEKDAVLRSFIQTKREQIMSKQRQLGSSPATPSVDGWGQVRVK